MRRGADNGPCIKLIVVLDKSQRDDLHFTEAMWAKSERAATFKYGLVIKKLFASLPRTLGTAADSSSDTEENDTEPKVSSDRI